MEGEGGRGGRRVDKIGNRGDKMGKRGDRVGRRRERRRRVRQIQNGLVLLHNFVSIYNQVHKMTS